MQPQVKQEIYKVDLVLNTLAFSADGCYLITNYRLLFLKNQLISSSIEHSGAKIFINKK